MSPKTSNSIEEGGDEEDDNEEDGNKMADRNGLSA